MPRALLRLPRDGLMGGRLKPVKARGGLGPGGRVRSLPEDVYDAQAVLCDSTLRPAGFEMVFANYENYTIFNLINSHKSFENIEEMQGFG